ncbi:MAG TPA: hypothetical protein VF594_08235 [Rubricoccaceae bacterium]|jgi:hypothetical protein
MLRLIPLAALLALAGCDAFSSDTRGVDLNVRDAQVAPGDEVLAVLDNDSGRAVTYSPCPQLGRLGADGFVPVSPNAICQSILVGVEAGGTIAFRIPVPADAPEGEYAVRIEVGREQPDQAVTSAAFRVVRAQ